MECLVTLSFSSPLMASSMVASTHSTLAATWEEEDWEEGRWKSRKGRRRRREAG